jgi:predicted esterase
MIANCGEWYNKFRIKGAGSMSLETFDELREEVFRLHQAAAYDAALILLEHEAHQFPEYEIRIDYWRVCFQALKGETSHALARFQAVLERGDWIGEALLHHDPDLISLQGHPDFERMVQLSEQKRRQAQLQVPSKRYVLAPEVTSAAPLIVVLHGNHDDAERQIRHWRSVVEAGWLLLVPQSSTLGADRTRFVWPDDDQQAFNEIMRHVEDVQQIYPLDLTRVVIAGFSRGAGLAAKLALRWPALGFIAVAPGFDEEWQPYFVQGQKNRVRGAVVVGKKDGGYAQTMGFIPRLRRADIPVEVFEVPETGHDYPSDFVWAAALEFITMAP